MKKILIILSLVLCACDNSDDVKKSLDKFADNLAKQEYEDCLNYAAKEFKNVASVDIEKTCKCTVDTIYLSDEGGDDRFAIDFRAYLKEKCGKNIPDYTLRDFPIK